MNFIGSLQSSDFKTIRSNLVRLARTHYLVKSHPSLLKQDSVEDFAHELFVELWKNKRFDYYVGIGKTDYEITRAIRNIELRNLLAQKIRKAAPEGYRLALRVSQILQTSSKFACKSGLWELTEWKDKATRNQIEIDERVKKVNIRLRNNAKSGGGGTLIISNPELEDLVCAVLTAIDSPVDLKTLRWLVLSRLNLIRVSLVNITNYYESEKNCDFQIADDSPTPIERLLKIELLEPTEQVVEKFLEKLFSEIKTKKEKQKSLALKVLWHFFLNPTPMNTMQMAFVFGAQKSLVYSWQNKISSQLKEIGICLEQADEFESLLKQHVKKLIEKGD